MSIQSQIILSSQIIVVSKRFAIDVVYVIILASSVFLSIYGLVPKTYTLSHGLRQDVN